MIHSWYILSSAHKGIIFMCLSALFFSISNVFIKTSSTIYPFSQMVVCRSTIFLVPLTLYLLYAHRKNKYRILYTQKLSFQVLQGLLNSLFLFLFFYAFSVMPLSDATALNFSETFIVTLFSILFLKEHVTKKIWGSLIIGFIGILFITNPSFENVTSSYKIGALVCILAMSIDAFVLILIRRLTFIDRPSTILFYSTFWSIIGGLLIYPFESWSSLEEHSTSLQLIGLGLFSALGQIFQILSLKYAPTSTVAPFIYTMMIWTPIFDAIIWNHFPSLSIWIGFSLICLSSLYIIRQEYLKEKLKQINVTSLGR